MSDTSNFFTVELYSRSEENLPIFSIVKQGICSSECISRLFVYSSICFYYIFLIYCHLSEVSVVCFVSLKCLVTDKFILWFLFLLLNAIKLWCTYYSLVLHQEMSGEPVLNTVHLNNLSGLYKLCCSEMSKSLIFVFLKITKEKKKALAPL